MENQIVETKQISSGGGFEHIFLRMSDGHIIQIHIPFGDIEKSYNKYESIDDYINDDGHGGFGFEYTLPNYDNRVINLNEMYPKAD